MRNGKEQAAALGAGGDGREEGELLQWGTVEVERRSVKHEEAENGLAMKEADGGAWCRWELAGRNGGEPLRDNWGVECVGFGGAFL
jgi:hypothetical protein